MPENEDHIQVFKEDLIPVTDRKGWFRDPDSNAIVNCNKSAYDQYMASYNKRENKEKAFNTLQKEVSDLKSDISDMKSMLLLLVEKKDAN